MRKILLFLFVCGMLPACKKAPKTTVLGTYTVEGYILWPKDKGPIAGYHIAVSEGSEAANGAAETYADSNGYFKLSYDYRGNSNYITLHPYESNYDCVPKTPILKNLPGGKDLNVGKVKLK